MRRNLIFGAGGFVIGAVLFGAVASFAAGPSTVPYTTPAINSPAFQQMYSACESFMAQYVPPATQAPQQ